MSQSSISEAAMVLLLWAAAAYRIWLSSRHERTVWRTAFTVCVVSVALGATFSAYGHIVVDDLLGVPNLAALLTHLALVVTAAATSIYVATLRRPTVPTRAIWWRVGIGAAVWVVQIVSWILAPVHDHQMIDFSSVWYSASVCVFNVTFALVIIAAAVENALFCLGAARSREDLTRTISMSLSGSACAAGAVLFVLGGTAIVLRYLTGSEETVLLGIFNASYPWVMVVLALGTLTLWGAPPVIDVVRHYRQWRLLKPLWEDLVDTAPEVHLNVPLTGGPRQRLRLRVQRTIVEIHDALRVTPVSVAPDATLEELGRALHSPSTRTGRYAAADVLNRAGTGDDDDITRLLTLARNYTRSTA